MESQGKEEKQKNLPLVTMKSPKNPNTHSNPVSIRTAEEFRAIAMVPPPEHEPPLSLEELAPKFGGSVILDGVDFSELTAIYSAAVHGTEFQQLAEWQSKPLREFEIREFQGAIRLDHRLLVWHDTQAHKTDGYKSFEKWLNKLHGCKMSRTTVYRRIGHARLAMVLAACGKIDALPGQNVAGRIAHWLPRTHWAAFLNENPEKSIGDVALDKNIFFFSEKHQVPLRREPINPPTSLGQSSPLALHSPEPDIAGEPHADEVPTKVPSKNLIRVLAPVVAGLLPKSTLIDPKKASKTFLTTAAEFTRLTPKPARNESRRQFHAALMAADPLRAKEFEDAALMAAYAIMEQRMADSKCSTRGTRQGIEASREPQ